MRRGLLAGGEARAMLALAHGGGFYVAMMGRKGLPTAEPRAGAGLGPKILDSHANVGCLCLLFIVSGIGQRLSLTAATDLTATKLFGHLIV